MYYCFLTEDISPEGDPLVLQKEYARRLGKLCIASLNEHTITDGEGQTIDLAGKEVLLRCSYDYMFDGLRFLDSCGADLIEREADIEQIEDWPALGLTDRITWKVSLSQILDAQYEQSLYGYLQDNETLFIKSVKKGFSAVVRSSRLLEMDAELSRFLTEECAEHGERLLISEYRELRADSLGSRESRHVVLDHQVLNSSRMVHTIRHLVPRSHRDKAQKTADLLRRSDRFPRNYVIDIGDFIGPGGQTDVDVIEINPLTCSMCYVNNSVFSTVTQEIADIHSRLHIGPEFCYNALREPQRYSMERAANKDYSYVSENRFFFT